MKYGKKSKFVVFFIVIFFVFFTNFSLASNNNFKIYYEPDCTSEYECAKWSECVDGLSGRICVDKKCSRRDIIERKICNVEIGCRPNIECGDWSQCVYTEKAELIFLGKISFGGYKERVCRDTNSCVESFVEEEPCKEEFPLELKKIYACGKEYLSALDIFSGREIARIDLESLESKKLNIIFIESEKVYCESCRNGLKDENEGEVDCGGVCMPCKAKSKISDKIINLSLWALAVFFSFFMVYELATRKKHK